LPTQQCATFSRGHKVRHVYDRLALASRADIGNFVDLQPVESTAVRKDEHVAVSVRDEHLGYGIFVSRTHSDTAFATAALVAIYRQRGPLQVATPTDGNDHVLFRDEVLDVDLALF